MKKRHPSVVGIAPGNEPASMEELGSYHFILFPLLLVLCLIELT